MASIARVQERVQKQNDGQLLVKRKIGYGNGGTKLTVIGRPRMKIQRINEIADNVNQMNI